MSDCAMAISNAVEEEFVNAFHYLCIWHVFRAFTKHFVKKMQVVV